MMSLFRVILSLVAWVGLFIGLFIAAYGPKHFKAFIDFLLTVLHH